MKHEHPLRTHRQALGLTQDELAHLAGCRHAAISRIEHRDLEPSIGLKVRLARALNVSVAELWEPVAVNEDMA